MDSREPIEQLIGTSTAIAELRARLRKIAAGPAATVLLTGESGTGKSVIARLLHQASRRSGGAFVNVTCTALPPTLLESELFGHERGAFTDAKEQRKGLFELADGGTIFLDEIGDIGSSLQAKLLGFLENRRFRRVGGGKDLEVDVRIIAATHRDLRGAVRRGTFREDLYYRLDVVNVEVPRLRDRRDDVLPLTDAFVAAFARQHGRAFMLTAAARAKLERHDWPGNVRELRNTVERAVLLADDALLDAADFRLELAADTAAHDFVLPPDGVDLEKVELTLVRQALERAHGNQTRAARLLGLSRDQVRYRLQKFGLWEMVSPAERSVQRRPAAT